MNEQDRLTFEWFLNNTTTKLLDFYNSVHIYNLARMYTMAQQGKVHTLIPADWPVHDNPWGVELLAASLRGVFDNESMQEKYLKWKHCD